MRFLLGLAWKNLSRYRKRTFITASAIAVGLAVYVFTDSMLRGAELESERNLLWYETSSARVMRAGYYEKRDQLPLDLLIEQPEPVLRALDAAGVPAAARVVFAGELIVREDPFPQDGSLRVKVYAIDPRRDDRVFRFRETVSRGRYLQPDEDGVLLGSWLAEDLGADVGYPVTIVTRTRDGFYQTIDAPIVGVLDCPNPHVNRSAVFLPLGAAEAYLDMQGAVSEIDLKLPERTDVDRAKAGLERDLRARFPDLEVRSWKELAADYVALAQQKQKGTGLILFLVFVIAAVGVSNTMLMAVYERVRELGTMRALGMGDAQIRWAFLLEAAGIGLIGSLIGVALGALLTWWLVAVGIDYSALSRQMDIGYRITGVFRGAWHPRAMLQAFVLGIMIATAVALVPTGRALKMRIADCLRDE